MPHFDTDYMAGAHPAVLQALVDTNLQMTPGYGQDSYCARAEGLILQACGLDPRRSRVRFTVGGTGTNVAVIAGLLRYGQGVLCADTAHIAVHEAGAVEATGHRVITVPAREGLIDASQVDEFCSTWASDDTHEHMVAPGMVYISQPTELGTLYTLSQLEELSQTCRRWRLPLYVDGARLAYALGAEDNDVTLQDLARLADLFYIGGTKCGAMMGEALVLPEPSLLPRLTTLVKIHGQLLAKGRLLGVQFGALFTDGLYEAIGRRADSLALDIRQAMLRHGYPPMVATGANQQFFLLPNALIDYLTAGGVTFELWGPRRPEVTPVRLVTSWATTEADVAVLAGALDAYPG